MLLKTRKSIQIGVWSFFSKKKLRKCILNYFAKNKIAKEQQDKILNSSCINFLHGTLAFNETVQNNTLQFAARVKKYFHLKFSTPDNEEIDFYTNPVYCDLNKSHHNEVLKFQQEYNFFNIDKESLATKSWGNTPLILACKIGNSLAATTLLQKHQLTGVSVNEMDNYGMTALHWACFFRQDELIEALLHAGADPHLKNISGQTPYDIYTSLIPNNLKIIPKNDVADSICRLPNVPHIAENKMSFGYTDGLDMSSMIDILFHMDKIAFHRLGVTQFQLESNLKVNTYNKSKPNSAFEVFVFYYFYDFIQVRNAIPKSENIAQILKKEQTDAITTNSDSTLVENPSFDCAVQILEAYGVVGKEIIKSMNRLKKGQQNHWNPYWMNSGKKLERIINAVEHNQNLEQILADRNSKLYKALNIQRLIPVTFFGSCGINQAKSLLMVTKEMNFPK